MTEQLQPPDQATIQALAEKLAAFTQSLPPAEATAFQMVMRQVGAGDQDVQGFGWWETQSSAGWFHFLSQALLAGAISQGMIVDEHLLTDFFTPRERGEPGSAPVAQPGALRPGELGTATS